MTERNALTGAPAVFFAMVLSAAAASAQPEPSLPMAFAGLALAQAQSNGIELSPDVAVARARVNGSRAALAAAQWVLAPAGFVGFTENPQLAPTGASAISAHQTTVGVQANLGDVFGYSPQVHQATAALHKAIADEAASERTERIAVARVYYGALKAAAVFAARTDALSLARAGLQAAQTRFNAGDAPRIDVVRAQVAAARAEAGAETGRADDANARGALRAETGIADSALSAATGGSPPSVSPLALDPDAAVAAALRLRPDVASAQRDVDASVSALTAAKFALLPPVTVATGYATGVDSGQRVAGAAVSAQMTVPLPFGPAARIEQARAALDEAAARLVGVKRTISLETASAARSLVAADRAAAATHRAEAAAHQELDATELGYRKGASSSLEVAAARSTYEQARLDELSAVYDEALAGAIFDVEVGR